MKVVDELKFAFMTAAILGGAAWDKSITVHVMEAVKSHRVTQTPVDAPSPDVTQELLRTMRPSKIPKAAPKTPTGPPPKLSPRPKTEQSGKSGPCHENIGATACGESRTTISRTSGLGSNDGKLPNVPAAPFVPQTPTPSRHPSVQQQMEQLRQRGSDLQNEMNRIMSCRNGDRFSFLFRRGTRSH